MNLKYLLLMGICAFVVTVIACTAFTSLDDEGPVDNMDRVEFNHPEYFKQIKTKDGKELQISVK